MRKKHSKIHMKGKGFFEDLKKYPVSTIGGLALPSLLGSAGGIAGSELGLLAGPVGAAIGGVAGSSLGSFAGKKIAEDWRRKGLGKMKGKGYVNRLSIVGSGNNTSLQGYTVSYNGTYQPIQGRGQTSAFGSISSEYGSVKF